jgi:hypothetical protein
MTFKLLKVAEETWRRIDGQELVRAGVRFVDGKRVEREDSKKVNTAVVTKRKRRKIAA